MNKLIKKELKRLQNKKHAALLQRYFKTGKGEYGEGDIFLGIHVPVLRKLAKQYRNISIREALKLLKSRFHEERLLSLFILADIFKRANDKDKTRIYAAYISNTKYINNWDLIDSSAGRIIGAYLSTRSKKPIYKLAKSKNMWERRIAIMSTSHFISNNSFAHTLKVSVMLLTDKEDLIHKAVGWMLREVGKRNLKIEESFLLKYYKYMPRTMLRYAIEKFPEQKRKMYLKRKK